VVVRSFNVKRLWPACLDMPLTLEAWARGARASAWSSWSIRSFLQR